MIYQPKHISKKTPRSLGPAQSQPWPLLLMCASKEDYSQSYLLPNPTHAISFIYLSFGLCFLRMQQKNSIWNLNWKKGNIFLSVGVYCLVWPSLTWPGHVKDWQIVLSSVDGVRWKIMLPLFSAGPTNSAENSLYKNLHQTGLFKVHFKKRSFSWVFLSVCFYHLEWPWLMLATLTLSISDM